MKVTLQEGKTEDVVKRMVFLAYNACGGSFGMGILQARNNVDEEQVWNGAYNVSDYGGGRKLQHLEDNEVYCDYVFGRMMKWRCKWTKDTITIRDSKFAADYQSFCRVYKDNDALVTAALASLNISKFTIEKR